MSDFTFHSEHDLWHRLALLRLLWAPSWPWPASPPVRGASSRRRLGTSPVSAACFSAASALSFFMAARRISSTSPPFAGHCAPASPQCCYPPCWRVVYRSLFYLAHVAVGESYSYAVPPFSVRQHQFAASRSEPSSPIAHPPTHYPSFLRAEPLTFILFIFSSDSLEFSSPTKLPLGLFVTCN
jgi:hypothetical protein